MTARLTESTYSYPLPECLYTTTTVGAEEPAPASGCCHPGLVALLAYRPADEKGN